MNTQTDEEKYEPNDDYEKVYVFLTGSSAWPLDLGFLGRGTLMCLALLFFGIFGAHAYKYYWEYIVDNLNFSDEKTKIRFIGEPKEVWHLFVLAFALLMTWNFGIATNKAAPVITVGMLIFFGCLIINFFLLRWTVENIELTLAESPTLNFNGSFLGYLGWNIVVTLSMFTIIGFSFALVGYVRWIMKNSKEKGLKLKFTGTGVQLLWRLISFFLGSIVVFTIPSLGVWILKWFVRNTVLYRRKTALEKAGSS